MESKDMIEGISFIIDQTDDGVSIKRVSDTQIVLTKSLADIVLLEFKMEAYRDYPSLTTVTLGDMDYNKFVSRLNSISLLGIDSCRMLAGFVWAFYAGGRLIPTVPTPEANTFKSPFRAAWGKDVPLISLTLGIKEHKPVSLILEQEGEKLSHEQIAHKLWDFANSFGYSWVHKKTGVFRVVGVSHASFVPSITVGDMMIIMEGFGEETKTSTWVMLPTGPTQTS